MRIIGRAGMEAPILAGLLLMGASGAGLLVAAALAEGPPPLVALLWPGFFGLGLHFGNPNALAMRPLGDLAGLGASIIASISNAVAFGFAFAVEAVASDPVHAIA